MSENKSLQERLNRIQLRNYKLLHPLEKIALNEDACKRLSEYFDCETGGECTPTEFMQQILLDTYQEMRIELAEKRLRALKDN